MVTKVRGVDLVDLGEVAHALEEDGRLDDVRELRARGLDDGRQVLEHLARLRLDVTVDDFHRRRVERDVARDELGERGTV